MNARLVFGILAVCGAASFAGAMLNIGLTLGAYWKSLPPAAFLDWFSVNSHFIGRTIPVFVIPTALGLVASLWIDWSRPGNRSLWLAAIACAIGIGVLTALYHLPANGAFATKVTPLDQVPDALDQWLILHAVRIALAMSSAVLALISLVRR